MKMLLFRPTFLTAAFALVVVLCSFVMTVSAAPQFGRPLLHALDELPTGLASAPVDVAAASLAASGTAATPTVDVIASAVPAADCEDQDSDPNPVNVAGLQASTTVSSTTPVVTNGALRSLGGTNAAVILSVVASAIFIAF
ncbi:hypothetical protein HYDPIDRAFT_170635 [Hydnomerulius pinastri MD-312]|uniref:Transmembrane protein n=1 Tax=Hydnomerulius pinastri MD-312 TaxID=994086 RepID=A0A0C9VQ05_9AGAM|nr:hypothetical protein HYDPIDRAFT_170635 [Hydnomerulius pinastri MD-312]